MGYRNFFNFILCLVSLFIFLKLIPGSYDAFVSLSVALVAIAVAEWMMNWSRKYVLHETVCPENKAILITGCDSGFGNQVAKRMDKLGYKVFAACLNKDGAGAKELMDECSENLTVIQMDVTDDQSIQEAKDFITNNLDAHDLWAVVNNAGIGQAGQVEWTTLEEFQAVYDVNATGPLRVVKAFLPLIKQSKGRIINTNSTAGRFHSPVFVGYCMSKSAAVALTTGLRIELAKWGVRVISIEPFFYSTPLTSEKATNDLIEKAWKNTPEDIKEDYGEQYKDAFKKKNSHCLNWYRNPRTYEVIDCFEDAITTVEPLSTYNPCHLVHKAGMKLFLALPHCVNEFFQRISAEPRIKPAALMQKKLNID